VIFNAAAVRMTGDPSHLQLLFDAEEIAVGFKPVSADDANGLKVTYSPSQATVTAAGFADRYNVPLGQRMRLEHDKDLGMFIAELPPANA
jgi:hypothetical protein